MAFFFCNSNCIKCYFVEMQENKEGLELLKISIEKAGYTGKVGILF
jgi:hypothetical protein